jgi:hypothetical protein
MDRSCYGTLLIAESRHRDDCARVARHALATRDRPATARASLAVRVKPVLAYARRALATLASVAFGMSTD